MANEQRPVRLHLASVSLTEGQRLTRDDIKALARIMDEHLKAAEAAAGIILALIEIDGELIDMTELWRRDPDLAIEMGYNPLDTAGGLVDALGEEVQSSREVRHNKMVRLRAGRATKKQGTCLAGPGSPGGARNLQGSGLDRRLS